MHNLLIQTRPIASIAQNMLQDSSQECVSLYYACLLPRIVGIAASVSFGASLAIAPIAMASQEFDRPIHAQSDSAAPFLLARRHLTHLLAT